MSNYKLYTSEAVKTEILEPASHSENQTEFKITGSVLTNLRLSNVGVFGNTAVATPAAVGSLSAVKHIILYDGRNVITQQRNFNDLMSFIVLLNSNDDNSELLRLQNMNQIGYRNFYKGDDNAAALYQRKTVIKNEQNLNIDGVDAPASTDEALVHLKKHLKMLQVVPVLSDKVFKQLRLVVEYETDFRKMISSDGITNIKICRPLLIVDRVHDPGVESSLLSDIKNVQWNEYERDNFFMASNVNPGVSPGSQTVSQKVSGFNNKNVQRIVIAKRLSDIARGFNGGHHIGYGPYMSLFGLGHEYQVTVNGRNLLPRDRINGPMREMALTSDTWGSLNLHEDSYMQMSSDIPVLDDTTQLGKQGQQNFFGIYVGEKIQDLKVEFKRDNFNDDQAFQPHNEGLRLEVTGEVVKQLEIVNGGYLVSYA